MGSNQSKAAGSDQQAVTAEAFQLTDYNTESTTFPPYKAAALASVVSRPHIFQGQLLPSVFPSELPERPPKPQRRFFGKKKSILNIQSPVESPIATFPLSPPLSPSPTVSTIFAPQSDSLSHVAQSHVSAHITPPPSPVSRGKFSRRPFRFDSVAHLRPATSSASLSPPPSDANPQRLTQLPYRIPSPEDSISLEGPISTASLSPDYQVRFYGKGNTGSDALAERFARLRLAHVDPSSSETPTSLPSPPAETSGILLPHNSTTSPVGDATDMVVTRHARRLQREHSRPYPVQSVEIKRKQIPDNRADQNTARYRVDHAIDINKSNGDPPNRHRRRTRRYSYTPDRQPSPVEDVHYPDLSHYDSMEEDRSRTVSPETPRAAVKVEKITPSVQEELDRMMAEQLQQQEDNDTQDQSDDEEIYFPASPTPSRRRTRPRNQLILNRRRTYRGTREDPIEIDLDNSLPDTEDDESLAQQLQQAAYGGQLGLEDERLRQEREDWVMAQLLYEEEQEQQRQESMARSRECAVCGDMVAIPDFPALPDCSHEPETCVSCFAGWIASELQGKGWRNIRCPGNECKVPLKHHEVQQYASQEVFEQFDTFSARDALNDDPNFRWCRAQGCTSGQIHDSGEEGNIFTCVACGFRVCVIHDTAWHEGETCEEYTYRKSGQKEKDQREQEAASVLAIGKFTKKCPGANCVYNIEKNDGCDHMTCFRCRHEFCWVCLAPYNAIRTKGNTAHKTNCRYHTSRIRD